MASGRTRLGTEHLVDGEYALERGHYDLLIELRRLAEICFLIKIFNLEDLCASLGSRRSNRGSLEFKKSFLLHVFAKGINDYRLHFEYRLQTRMTKSECTMIELRRELEIESAF